MTERQTINTNIRLNLAKEDDRRAWEYLQSMDRKEFRSYSRAVVAALNDYFSRKERLAADPFLETRERQNAFLNEVKDAVRECLQEQQAGFAGFAALLQGIQGTAKPAEAENDMSDEAFDAAMDFIGQL